MIMNTKKIGVFSVLLASVIGLLSATATLQVANAQLGPGGLGGIGGLGGLGGPGGLGGLGGLGSFVDLED